MPETVTVQHINADPALKVVIVEGAFIPNTVSYTHGQTLPAFNVANATLRDLAAERKNGRVTANAKKAATEVARRKLNKMAKRQAANA